MAVESQDFRRIYPQFQRGKSNSLTNKNLFHKFAVDCYAYHYFYGSKRKIMATNFTCKHCDRSYNSYFIVQNKEKHEKGEKHEGAKSTKARKGENSFFVIFFRAFVPFVPSPFSCFRAISSIPSVLTNHILSRIVRRKFRISSLFLFRR